MNRAAALGQARRAMAAGQFAAATAVLETAVAENPGNAALWRALGQARYSSRDASSALVAFDQATSLEPQHADGLLGRGHALRTLGRTDQAAASYRAALVLRPDLQEAWWSLAALKTLRFSAEDTARLRTLAQREDAGPPIFYALGRALEQVGQYEEAFAAWEEGGRRTLARQPYDVAADRRFAGALRAAFTPAHIGRLRVGRVGAPRPVFIVGLPRAGSTLVEQILAAHPMVSAVDEPPFLGQATAGLQNKGFPSDLARLDPSDFNAVGDAYRCALSVYARGRAVVVDKNPNNFWLIGVICCAMPDATIIYARRDPLDQCVSAFSHLFAAGFPFTSSLSHLGAFWRLADSFIQDFSARFPGRVHCVDYEDLVAHQERVTRRLLHACRLDWDENCLHFFQTQRPVHTASAEQVTQPLYATSIGVWKRYKSLLGPLEQALWG